MACGKTGYSTRILACGKVVTVQEYWPVVRFYSTRIFASGKVVTAIIILAWPSGKVVTVQ